MRKGQHRKRGGADTDTQSKDQVFLVPIEPRKPPTPAQLAARFKKNGPNGERVDPRINRKGRLTPKHAKDLNDMLDEIFGEEVELTVKRRKIVMSRLRWLLISMMGNPSTAIHLLERRFGKVKEQVEVNGTMRFGSWKEFMEYDGDPDDDEDGAADDEDDIIDADTTPSTT